MVLEFVRLGRYHEFLNDLHAACSHLADLAKLESRERKEEATSALSFSDALLMHLKNDAESLRSWHQELARLVEKSRSFIGEASHWDLLDAAELRSVLSRAESSLAAAVEGYETFLNRGKGGHYGSGSIPHNGSSPGSYLLSSEAKAFLGSIHQHIFQAKGFMNHVEAIVSRISDRIEAKGFEAEIESGKKDQHIPIPSSEHIPLPSSGAFHASASSLGFEISSAFSKQWERGEVSPKDFHTALRKVENFVKLGNTPSIPWHGEPHCYGGAPNHLNGVVAGRQERLIYFVDNTQFGTMVKVCCWISDACHKDAFSHLRHHNLYRRILSKDSSEKITRNDFGGFMPLEYGSRWKTVSDQNHLLRFLPGAHRQ